MAFQKSPNIEKEMTNTTSFTVFVCYVFFGITCMVFCYKFGSFAEFWNFCLAKYGGRLIHGYSKTCIFGAKKQGVDLYTDSTYTPENTVLQPAPIWLCSSVGIHSNSDLFQS